MTRITLDAALLGKLHNLSQPLELCDETGKVLAQLIPVHDPSENELYIPEFNEEELQHQEQSGKWYSTEEVLAHLKSLEKQ
jgi:hypothetical protein